MTKIAQFYKFIIQWNYPMPCVSSNFLSFGITIYYTTKIQFNFHNCFVLNELLSENSKFKKKNKKKTIIDSFFLLLLLLL